MCMYIVEKVRAKNDIKSPIQIMYQAGLWFCSWHLTLWHWSCRGYWRCWWGWEVRQWPVTWELTPLTLTTDHCYWCMLCRQVSNIVDALAWKAENRFLSFLYQSVWESLEYHHWLENVEFVSESDKLDRINLRQSMGMVSHGLERSGPSAQ